MIDTLTPRQQQIAILVATTGASNAELAHALGVAVPTIRNILTRAYRRLHIDNSPHNKRIALTRWAWEGRA